MAGGACGNGGWLVGLSRAYQIGIRPRPHDGPLVMTIEMLDLSEIDRVVTRYDGLSGPRAAS